MNVLANHGSYTTQVKSWTTTGYWTHSRLIPLWPHADLSRKRVASKAAVMGIGSTKNEIPSLWTTPGPKHNTKRVQDTLEIYQPLQGCKSDLAFHGWFSIHGIPKYPFPWPLNLGRPISPLVTRGC